MPGKLSAAIGLAVNPTTTKDVAVTGTEVQQVRIDCNDPPLLSLSKVDIFGLLVEHQKP